MQIVYNNSIDHWIAGQIFISDQLTTLKKYDKKNLIKLFVYLILMDLLIYFAEGTNEFFRVFTFLVVIWGLVVFLPRTGKKKAQLFNRLRIAFGSEFEKEPDKTVIWDITPERFIMRDYCKETSFKWDAIDKIVVCPDYFFVYFGFAGWGWLPKRAVIESDYQSFCDAFIQMYQQHGALHEKPAEIIHSDWNLDLPNLAKTASSRTSVKKICFTILWAIIFLITGLLFSGLIVFSIIIFESTTDILPFEEGDLSIFLTWGFLIVSAALGLLGLFLGLLGKLPGTKTNDANE